MARSGVAITGLAVKELSVDDLGSGGALYVSLFLTA